MKKYILILLLVIASGCKKDAVAPVITPVKVSVGMVEWAGFAPLNVAKVKGLFSAQNLDVEVKVFSDNRDLATALKNGTVDIALDMIGSWLDIKRQGNPIVILGMTDWSNGGDKIILSSAITDSTQLTGKKAGIYLNLLSVQNFLATYLAAKGLTMASFASITEESPSSLSDKFIANQYSLIVNYDPQAARAVTSGSGKVSATSADYPGVIPEGFATTSTFLSKTSAATMVAFFDAWIQAVEWTKNSSNKNEYYTILNIYTFVSSPDFSNTELDKFLADVKVFNTTELPAKNNSTGEVRTYSAGLNVKISTGKLPGTVIDTVGVFRTEFFMQALQN